MLTTQQIARRDANAFCPCFPLPADIAAPPGSRGTWVGNHLLSVSPLSRGDIDRMIEVASWMEQQVDTQGGCDVCAGMILATVFYEPSTRTSSSFQAAMMRLGGKVINIADVANSSVSKGETLEDTMRCVQAYCNIIALRHPQVGAAMRAASVLSVPLLNAGDGTGEHPTQALLDLYTIQRELGGIDGREVTMVGDLKNGRTVHSLAKVLTLFNDITINLVSPASLSMPDDIVQVLDGKGVKHRTFTDLSHCLNTTDVLYVTRVQKERFQDLSEYESVKDAYIITQALLHQHHAKPTLRILHPLPRVNELATDLDDDPRSAYFRQMKHGLHVRMALIALLLGRA